MPTKEPSSLTMSMKMWKECRGTELDKYKVTGPSFNTDIYTHTHLHPYTYTLQ